MAYGVIRCESCAVCSVSYLWSYAACLIGELHVRRRESRSNTIPSQQQRETSMCIIDKRERPRGSRTSKADRDEI